MAAWVEMTGIIMLGGVALWSLLAPKPALQPVPIRVRRTRR